MYFSGSSEELWVLNFIQTSWTTWRNLFIFFQIIGKSHLWILYSKILGRGLCLKTTTILVFFLWLPIFEKLLNNRLADQPKKCSLFSDFQYGFSYSCSTADLLMVLIIELLGLLIGLGLLKLQPLYQRFSIQFDMLAFFRKSRWLQVVLDGQSFERISSWISNILKAPFLVLLLSYCQGLF